MTDVKATYLAKLWIDHDKDLSRQIYSWAGEERQTADTLAEKIKELLWEKAPLTDGMYSDLLELSLTSVDCLSIAEVIMSDVRKAACGLRDFRDFRDAVKREASSVTSSKRYELWQILPQGRHSLKSRKQIPGRTAQRALTGLFVPL